MNSVALDLRVKQNLQGKSKPKTKRSLTLCLTDGCEKHPAHKCQGKCIQCFVNTTGKKPPSRKYKKCILKDVKNIHDLNVRGCAGIVSKRKNNYNSFLILIN